MKRAFVVLGMVAAAATTARAQRSFAYEAGLFAEYTKFADTTNLKSNIGGGVRAGIFVLPKIELEYEASLIPTSSATQSSLKAWNNRIDAVLNWPLAQNTMLLIGTGFTGTNYKGDTTHNAYDSGWNVLGRHSSSAWSSSWSWRIDRRRGLQEPFRSGVSDRTDPDIQWSRRRELVHWRPCEEQPVLAGCRAAAPAPAPAPPPPPAPAPAPRPLHPYGRRAGSGARCSTATTAGTRARTCPRAVFTLKGVLFEFNKSTLTKGARDTLGVAVRYLKDHGDARVEVQGHTDSKGSDEYNMKLGERRAESVKSYLTKQGIAADRISTRSFGKSDPVADNEIDAQGQSGWARAEAAES